MSPRRPGEPVRSPEPFDPLGLDNLQRVLRERLEDAPLENFPPGNFQGAGVYALYYTGDLDFYQDIVGRDCPIYIGKAEAGNSNLGLPVGEDSFRLAERITDHLRSVRSVSDTLKPADFQVRLLVVDDAWIVLAERALLRAYRPVLWNAVILGFGSNPPGGARKNARSEWDTVHPGRPRAGGICHRTFTRDEMIERVEIAAHASTLPEGPERDAEIKNKLDSYPRKHIWRRKKKNETGAEVVVYDSGRFESEMRRMSLDIPDYRLASMSAEPAELDDEWEDEDAPE